MPSLFVASKNEHKVREITQVLAPKGFEVMGLATFPDYEPPAETGSTFLENAAFKANALKWFLAPRLLGSGFFILADDSGLECEDLDGRPGVYSARFAGLQASDADNNQKLLASLQALNRPLTRRARYVCALFVILPDGTGQGIEETCEGEIVFSPRGQNGFGYDPYFYLPDQNKTMAELPAHEKNQISHRGKALRALCQKI